MTAISPEGRLDPHEPLYRPFFAALAVGELRFPCCLACGRFHWYPKVWCPYCQSRELIWVPVRPQGTLFSWTTVHHAFTQEFQDKVPYTVGLIEFPDAPGIRFVAGLNLAPDETPICGMPVVCELTDASTLPLVRFRAA